MTAWRQSLRWQIRQPAIGNSIADVNAAILDDLAGGVEAIELVNVLPDQMALALDGVLLDVAPVSCMPNMGEMAWALVDEWDRQGIAGGDRRGSLGVDPIAVTGHLDPAGEAALVSAAAMCIDRSPGVRSVGVRWGAVGAPVAKPLGTTPEGEIGEAIAIGIAYLRALADGGLTAVDAANQIEFSFTATADQFVTIAKLRAARRMWARVLETSGIDPLLAPQYQQATVTAVNDDQWRAVLESTTACFAAGVGGADAVTVWAVRREDGAIDANDLLMSRMARNVHHLLLDEAHVGEFVDPTDGSGYIEALSDQFARSGWALVQAIETAGGMAEVLDAGSLTSIGDSWQASEDASILTEKGATA